MKQVDEEIAGWRPMKTAPLPDLETNQPEFILGLTTHNNVVVCKYIADGDGIDRWGWPGVIYKLIAWRPLHSKPTQNELRAIKEAFIGRADL